MASAGSGKTFTLAKHYIEILMGDPGSYGEILAVTFTLKATAEMKERILCQLQGLRDGLEDSRAYLEEIMDDLGMDEAQVRAQAGKALGLILRDMSNFNVETIDSFFQRVLRGIARELGLRPGLRIELDGRAVEKMAVDRLLARLEEGDEALDWIMAHIRERMADGRNWNVVDDIKEFGKNIFSHGYTANAEAIGMKLREPGFIDAYMDSLKAVVGDADAGMRKEGEDFFAFLGENGRDVEDLKNGLKGPAGYFDKLRKGMYHDEKKVLKDRVKDVLGGSVDGWFKKGDRNDVNMAFARILTARLIEVEGKRNACMRRRNTAIGIRKNLHNLRLMERIGALVRDINSGKDAFLLSDTQAEEEKRKQSVNSHGERNEDFKENGEGRKL